MLPLYFVSYATVAFFVLPRFAALHVMAKSKLIFRHSFAYAAFGAAGFMFSAATFAGLQYGAYVLK